MNARGALAVLHGQSQVYFQNSAVTGVLFLLAFAVADVRLALFALLGALVQSGVSWLVPAVDRRDVVEGKHGFCGALTAVAACTALGPSLGAVVWAVLGSAACVGLVVLMDRYLGVRGLPAMTAPFCVVSGVAVVLTRSLQPAPAAPTYLPTHSLLDPVVTVLDSVAQVVLLDSVWSGALILLGLFAASWEAGVWSVLGAAVASTVGWFLHQDSVVILNGLDGYSGVLVALALGTVFLGQGQRRIWITLAGVVLTVPVQLLLSHTGVPVYTWPFILVTWAVLLAARWLPAPAVSRPAPAEVRPGT